MKEQKIFTNVAEIFIIKRLFKKNYLLLKGSLKLHDVLRYFLCATNLSTVTHMHSNKRAKMKWLVNQIWTNIPINYCAVQIFKLISAVQSIQYLKGLADANAEMERRG